jgi:hypothetical protein
MKTMTLLIAIITLCGGALAQQPARVVTIAVSSPLDSILSRKEQEVMGLSQLSVRQKEALRRAIINLYMAGFNQGKEEAAKALIPSLRKSVPAGEVTESQIDSEFEGWEGETIVKLINGQIWQQTEYYYIYHYAYMPEVLVYRSSFGYKMKVDGVDRAVGVTRLR